MDKTKSSTLYIETDRLIIRTFDLKDMHDLFEIVSDEETCSDDGGYKPFYEMDGAYNQLMQKFAEDTGRFVIQLKEAHKVVGLIHLSSIDNRAVDAYDIGYVVNKNYRKQGYGYEAISNIIDYCFNKLQIDMITASVFPWNKGSMNMLDKLGFIKEGITHKAAIHCKEGIVDMINYYIER